MSRSFLQPKWKNTGLSEYRFEQLHEYFINRRVLDLGCAVGHKRPNWMHQMIQQSALYLKGLDIDCEAVAQIREKGFNVVCGDAQNFELDEKFDLIHAGELIEHLDDLRGFLSSCKKHLTPNGLLLITTPNAMRFANMVYTILGGLEVNKQHICWFCDKTITTLLNRNGFDVVLLDYLEHESRGFTRKLTSSLLRFLMPKRVAWNTMMVLAKGIGD
jgi:2-polyprenyl-3-methyl-5-hydroxy-6-metoxy-1,4-benzoquinol methylase